MDTNEFLIELARAAQRYGMYPEGHSSHATTAQELQVLLDDLLKQEGNLVIRVARDHLVVGEEKTDSANAVLVNLARRLRQHQLFEITFKIGVEEGELEGFLGRISAQVGKVGEPFGTSPPEELKRWKNINIQPTPYDSLALTGDEVDDLDWSDDALSRAASAGVKAGSGATSSTAGADKGEQSELHKKVSGILGNLGDGGRQQLLEMFDQLLDAEGVDGSADNAILKLVEVSKGGSADKQSALMLALISKVGKKMGAESSGASDVGPGEILNELVGQLSGEGDEAGVLPDTPEEERVVWVGEIKGGRILQMSVELNEVTPATQMYMKKAVGEGDLGVLVKLLEGAPKGNAAAEMVLKAISKPKNLRRLLGGGEPDLQSFDRILPLLGMKAARPLLRALGDAEDETVQRGIVERLIRLGDRAGVIAAEHLSDPRWHVRSGVLRLMEKLDELPEGFSFSSFYKDDNKRVRRQALGFGLERGEDRGEMIMAALCDPDPEIAAFGLREVKEGCPAVATKEIVSLATDPTEPGVIRRACIKALGSIDSPSALSALLRLTWQRKLVVMHGLSPKSAEMIEALGVLAASRSDDSKAKRVLHAAAKSKDPQIKAAAGRQGGAE